VTRPPRATFIVVAISLLLSACTTGSVVGQTSDASASPTALEVASGGPLRLPSVVPGGAPTLRDAIAKLCVPASNVSGTPASGELPPELTTIARQVEHARGHEYVTPPTAEAISDQEMDRRLRESFRAYYPKDLYDRRTFAWRTIGVIPTDTDLYHAYRTFLTGGVIGFYDPETGELVYEGSGDLGFTERLTLAHELTHALDDQIFDLKRLDALTNACQDERFAGALGLVEGSAQYFSAASAAENPDVSLGDLLEAIANAVTSGSAPQGVPPFLYAINLWPYSAGMAFVGTLAGQGGTPAVDRAFEHLPVSTEQVIHPELYPTDKPVSVDIADITAALGPGWGDLDAMTIGEEWLRALLELRLDGDTADAAAAGWGGGGYRAFTDGTDVAVVLQTAWDTAQDAVVFADALDAWGAGDDVPPTVMRDGAQVAAVFGTSAKARDKAAAAL
jgi:hypothetical protein